MQHRTRRVVVAILAAMVIGSATAAVASAHGPSGNRWDLVRAAVATARFHSTNQASRAGYGPFPEGVPLHECISSLDNTGAMGFHWLNGNNLTANLDPTKPQVLVYAPDRRGDLHLVALEYVVFQTDWIAAHGNTTPMLFGQMFMATPDNNRYQIPAFFSLHVWLWKYNPSGLFAPFNPNVSCDPGSGGHGSWWDDSRGGDADRAMLTAAHAGFVCSIAKPMQM
jgi:hypothetical protein